MIVSRRVALVMLLATASTPVFAQLAPTSVPIRIGVIGAGSLGGTVGRIWVRNGHHVMFSSRHPDELASMVRELGPHASIGTPEQAASFGTVVLFAVPYDAMRTLSQELQVELRGKLVLDACNVPLRAGGAEAQATLERGVGETTAALMPEAKLVRAFSAVDASLIEQSAGRSSGRAGVPIAGDDPAALRTAAQLVRDAGCDPVIVGNLAAARKFQQGQPGFRANTTAPELRRILGLPDNA